MELIVLILGIAGYGNMGRLIHRLALEKGHHVAVVIDPNSDDPVVTSTELTSTDLPLDVIIDFTEPGVALNNISTYSRLGVSAVIGTTGWQEDLKRAEQMVVQSSVGLIWSSNFSPGVYLFSRLVKAAGQLFSSFENYDPFIHEIHHRHKVDSPSGTGLSLGELMLSALAGKESLATERLDRRIGDREIHLSSTRGGSVPGVHQVFFDSPEDTILLEHCARNREGFATGALYAAEWIKGKTGFYCMDDLMQSIIGGVSNGS